MITIRRMTMALALLALVCLGGQTASAAPAGVDTYDADYWNTLAAVPAGHFVAPYDCDPCGPICQKGHCQKGCGYCPCCPPISMMHLKCNRLHKIRNYCAMRNQFLMRDWDAYGPYGGAQFPGYGCRGYGSYYNPDLFYNYYIPQSSCAGMTAGMYTCPHDVPPPVLQTYYTYQPFLPHEFMYTHHRRYTRWHNGGAGKTTTLVHWHTSDRRRLFDRGLIKYNFNGGLGGYFTNGSIEGVGAGHGYGAGGDCVDGDLHGSPEGAINAPHCANIQSTRR